MRDRDGDLAGHAAGKAAALKPFSPGYNKSTKGMTDIQCSSMLTDDRTGAAVRLSCGMPSHLRTCQAVWQGFINLPILRATGTGWVLSGGHVSLEHWDFDGNDSVFSKRTSKRSVFVIGHTV